MYTPPWIPRADAAFRGWAQIYCSQLNNNPAMYGQSPAQTLDLMRRYFEFNAAYMVAASPATRTRGMIFAKQDARSILQTLIEHVGADIRANLGVTDGDKIVIGVRPRNIAHKPRRCPGTSPLLNYIGSMPGIDELRYRDTNTPTSKAKPRGAERLELWVAYSVPGMEGTKLRKEDARLVGSFKKNPIRVEQDAKRDVRLDGTGKPTYWARWAGFDGEVGPWSLACHTSQRIGMGKAGAKNAAAAKRDAKSPAADADQPLLFHSQAA